jgi:homoserine O-acetyltransferase
MGGMTVLEYPLNTPPGFVRTIIPIATSARHSAWCISWGETQRQSIYSDPDYVDGYYYNVGDSINLTNQPARGLGAARMAALLTYRSRDSFESRFGRRAGVGGSSKVPNGGVRIMGGPETTDPAYPSEAEMSRSPGTRAWMEHNDGHRSRRGSDGTKCLSSDHSDAARNGNGPTALQTNANGKLGTGGERPPKVFSAQSYLRYQGEKASCSPMAVMD